MLAAIRFLLPAVAALSLAACVSMPAPTYQPSVDISDALLKSEVTQMQVAAFGAAPGVENNSLSVRGSRLTTGSDGTYAGYLREALVNELKAGGRYDGDSDVRISGTLTHNELNGAGIKIGTALVGARFQVERDDAMVYDKALQTAHEWESSFVGAIAIPAAFDNYATAVQKLLLELLTDPDFLEATRERSP
ncbi:hypothetical protein H0E84_18165 [Luteimonas sp. SJ-92]|uniref:DUF4410 domain-containing protein n=1 Tax=Luteimonas salinisoli TaxID=2752307 RepID=A0A853JHS8_9GAMM|nr:hypothetical protein [Luteimonas salinisoli]NZA28304.1 hypothetical protein [Luteimonas salinisoli]